MFHTKAFVLFTWQCRKNSLWNCK